MKNIKTTISFFIFLFFLQGCYNESKLHPSEGLEDIYSGEYSLPQGNHDYDQEILVLFEKYKTMFLYKYEPNDIFFNVISDLSGSYNAENNYTNFGFFSVPADEKYIGNQLDLIKETLLDFFPDEFLKVCFPQKIFLVDSLYYSYGGEGKPLQSWWIEFHSITQSANHFVISWGGERVLNLTPNEKLAIKNELVSFFLSSTVDARTVNVPSSFASITNYSQVTSTNYYQLGALNSYYTPDYRITLDRYTDWKMYIYEITSTPYDQLIAPGGVLHKDIDVNGLIRKKYDIMIDYFKEVHNVDLQKIGNTRYD